MKILELKIKGYGKLCVKVTTKDNCKYIQTKWDVEILTVEDSWIFCWLWMCLGYKGRIITLSIVKNIKWTCVV